MQKWSVLIAQFYKAYDVLGHRKMESKGISTLPLGYDTKDPYYIEKDFRLKNYNQNYFFPPL